MKGFVYLALYSLTLLALISITSGQDTPCGDTCKNGSACVKLYNTSFCQCENSLYYKNETCNKGDVFSGKLIINSSYVPDLENKMSLDYQNLHDGIKMLFSDAFGNDIYGKTIIVKVSPSISARHGKREANRFGVTIRNILNMISNLTEENVTQIIQEKVVKTNPLILLYSNQLRPCDDKICDDTASCVNLYSEFFCQCQDSNYYKNGTCNEGKVFPGTITMNLSYTTELENKESLSYQKLYIQITTFFEGIFKDLDYGETIIQKVSPHTSSRYGIRAAKKVDVALLNMFSKGTSLTEQEVSEKITKAVKDSNDYLSYINKTRPCQVKNNCTADAKCVDLDNQFICLCPEGYYYKEEKCIEGKVFPGTFTLNMPYTSELEDKESSTYQELYFKVKDLVEGAFGLDYGQTVFHKVSPSISRRNAEYVSVSVVNILIKDTTLTEENVSKKINEAMEKLPDFESYKGENRCDYYGCEENDSNDCSGFKCVCKFGMYRPYPQSPQCVPDPCPQNCSSKPNMHCQWNSTQKVSKCVCLPDYMEDKNGNCQKCAFGYSGENCQDQFQLILTIVGSLAGACILAMVIAVTVMGVRLKHQKKKNERQVLVENDFQNMGMQHTEFSMPGKDGSLFPKARITPSSQFQNPYSFSENSRGIPRPDY